MIYTITASLLSVLPDAHCLENDFAMCCGHSLVPHVTEAFQSEMFMVFFCLQGNLDMNVDDETQVLHAGDALLYKPFSVIHQFRASRGCKDTVLFFSPHVMDHLLPACKNLSRVLDESLKPVIHFSDRDMKEHIIPLLDMLKQHTQNMKLPFRSNTLYHLFALLLFEILNRTCPPASKPETREEPDNTTSRIDSLYNHFMKHLSEDAGRHRTVSYFADILCVSPKHLSKVIKKKTGTRALEIIHRNATLQIKLDLKLTDIPIKQLAAKYNFENFSFFCQFMKAHLGMTAQQYRNMRIKTTESLQDCS